MKNDEKRVISQKMMIVVKADTVNYIYKFFVYYFKSFLVIKYGDNKEVT